MYEWSVFLNGKCIETAFFTSDCGEIEVRQQLVERYGFDPDIRVVCANRIRQRRMFLRQEVQHV